jgi:hypothetical protein
MRLECRRKKSILVRTGYGAELNASRPTIPPAMVVDGLPEMAAAGLDFKS